MRDHESTDLAGAAYLAAEQLNPPAAGTITMGWSVSWGDDRWSWRAWGPRGTDHGEAQNRTRAEGAASIAYLRLRPGSPI